MYVDDVILAGTSLAVITDVKKYLHNAFQIKDVGPLKYFLGSEVARSALGINICQRKCTLELLKEFGYLHRKLVTTPIDCSSQAKHSFSSDLYLDISLYRRLVGKLLYLTITDISFAVQLLSRHLNAPSHSDFPSAFQIIVLKPIQMQTGLVAMKLGDP